MSEWQECRLGDIGVVVTGKTPSSKNLDDFGHDIPFVTPTDYRNYHKGVSFAGRYLSYAGAEKLKNKILPPQSVMVTCIGSDMGKVAINSIPVVTNQQINSIISNISKVDPDFLYYKLVESYDVLRSYGLAGTALPIVNKTDFEGVAVLIPPLREQCAIAGVLSSLDDKIDLLHRQNKTLEGMAEALWRKMFVPACASEPHADREEADPGWKKGKLGNIAEINPLRSIKKGTSAIYIDMSNMPTNGPFPREWVQREFTSGMKFRNGDTIIARITPCLENGKTAYVNFLNNDEIAWGSTEYIILAPKVGYCSEWFYFLARNNDFRDFAIQNMTGTSGRQRVSGDSIAQYEIAIPTMNISERFRKFAGPVMEHIKENAFQIRTLSRLRDTLLPKLMSGEVRVKL